MSERDTMPKDVQDMAWDCLRVRLPRIVGPVVLTRVQGQQWLYKKYPYLKEGLHNNRMSWGEYKQIATSQHAPPRAQACTC